MIVAPPPLASSGRTPVLHGVLGAEFHLETLLPEDEPRIEAANQMILAWIGADLRFTLNAFVGVEEAFDPEDLTFASAYASSLAIAPPDPRLPDESNRQRVAFDARRRSDMGIACHGGEGRLHASPWSYRFYADILAADDTRLVAPAILRVTVPSTWPLDDFARRVLAIASVLRLRWGAAGLTYSAWETQLHEHAMKAIYAHARRYPGYDVGLYLAWMEEFFLEVRSVSWLTILGPSMQAKLAGKPGGLPESGGPLVALSRAGDHLVLQAGAAPEAGDVNRMHLPAAYLRADELIRPIRAREGISFYESWTEATTTKWLRRFEKRLF